METPSLSIDGMEYFPQRVTLRRNKVDNWSARGWYDYPKAEGDEWTGATRVRTSI